MTSANGGNTYNSENGYVPQMTAAGIRWTKPEGEVSESSKNVNGEDFSGEVSGVDSVDEYSIDEIANTFADGPNKADSVMFEDVIGNHEERIAQFREELDELIAAGNAKDILEFALKLGHDDTFQSIAQTRTEQKNRYEEESKLFDEGFKNLLGSIDSEDGYDGDPHDIYVHGSQSVESYEQSKALGILNEDYQNLIAEAIGEYQKHSNMYDTVVTAYEGDIGASKSVGYFETGSREWLENRQNGIGGSDIGKIADEDNEYYKKNLESLFESKVEPISDEQVAEQEYKQDHVVDAVSRGNAMEDFIGEAFARLNPDVQVLHSKDTYRRPGSVVQTNYDFLLSSRKDGVPDGNLEIKTSTNPDDWGDESEGLDGVPKAYRAQALSQAYEGGFSHGAIAVMINASEMRTYKFKMTPELTQEAHQNYQTAEKVFEMAQDFKENPIENGYLNWTKTKGIHVAQRRKRASSKPTKGFPKAAVGNSKSATAKKESLFAKIGKINGVPASTIAAKYKEALGDQKETQETLTVALNKVMEQEAARQSAATGSDFEFNKLGKHEVTSRPTELGIVGIDMQTGEKTELFNSLFKPTPASMHVFGTGDESVSHITKEMVADKPEFRDPKVQREVLDALLDQRFAGPDGNIDHKTHNYLTEFKMYAAQLEGFAEAVADGRIRMTDTMDYTKWYMGDTPDNKLSSFARGNGVVYDDDKAHRAYQDTEVMMDAWFSMAQGIREKLNG